MTRIDNPSGCLHVGCSRYRARSGLWRRLAAALSSALAAVILGLGGGNA